MTKNTMLEWENPFPESKNFLIDLLKFLEEDNDNGITFIAFKQEDNKINSIGFFLQSQNLEETIFDLGIKLGSFSLKYGVVEQLLEDATEKVFELDLSEEVTDLNKAPLLLNLENDLIKEDVVEEELTLEERVKKLEYYLKS